MKVQAKTIEELFKEAGDREKEMRELNKIIQESSSIKPELFRLMNMVGLAYGIYHYKSKSGREGDWPLISLAPQKNYISLYICAVKDGKYLPEIYGKKLGKVSVGKSCIRFTKLANVNLKEVKKIIKEAADLQKAGKNPFFVMGSKNEI